MLGLIGRIILILAIAGSFGFFFNEIRVRRIIIGLGKKDEKRWDNLGPRIVKAGARMFSQLCAVETRPITGIFHAFVFWGFVFFAIATIDHVGGAFKAHFSLLGTGVINDLWFLGVDITGVLTMIGAAALAIRRYIIKPEAIKKPVDISKSPQSAWVLAIIFALMVTYFLNQASEINLTGEAFASWMPVSQLTATLLAPMGDNALGILHAIAWWSHILMILGFLFLIPHSKHFHLVAGPVNVALRSTNNVGYLRKMDLENSEEFGVTQVTDYQWKTLLDAFSCIECGRCQDKCPAYQSDKPLSPKVIMMKIRKHLLHERKNLLAKGEASEPIMNQWITEDEIWSCTTCGACMTVCPVMNEHIPAIVELRQAQVLMESKFPQELNLAFKGLETNANPWNMGAASRFDWAEGLDVPTVADKDEVDYLWFVGCAGSFDDKAKATSKALAKILNAAGVSYAVLGADEQCCGDPARRSGNEYVFQMLAQANVDLFKEIKFKKIITACPHCFNMLKEEYPQFGGEFEVVHHSEVIAELLAAGKIKINQNGVGTASFHDSCYLGRYQNIYDAPRQVLEAVSGKKTQELSRHHDSSFCCGAGGARMFMEENLGTRINHMRIDEAAKAGVDTLGVACPFCLTMLQDAVKEKELDGTLSVQDIAQLVADRL